MARVQMYGNPVATLTTGFNTEYDVSDWSHRITATIGFDTARFTLRDEKYVLEDLFSHALGRRVVRYSSDGNSVIWEGYVDELTLNVPGLSKRISLREMYNRVAIRYIPIDVSANPPTESAETSTAVVNNTASQSMYGIKETTFTPPHDKKLTTTHANQQANTILAQYRQPGRSDDVRSGANEVGLIVNCSGYMHTLAWRK